jgi:CDAN1-interacting nuclease 1
MEPAVYEKIVELINGNESSGKQALYEQIKCIETLSKCSLSYETFTSIYGNIKRRSMFRTSHWRRLRDSSIQLCLKYKEYEKQEQQKDSDHDQKTSLSQNIILKLARENKLAPVLMARLVVEGFIKSGCLRLKPEAYVGCMGGNNNKDISKISVSNLLKETHLISDGRLAHEIVQCCAVDDDYGPSIDFIKNLIGIEYEIKLENILKENGICYKREDELRERGFDKTPDFKLDIPLYVAGRVINWIDSKATFGDELSHNEYYEAQFKSYLNRFGSGLVIYWFGYMSTIQHQYQLLQQQQQHHYQQQQQQQQQQQEQLQQTITMLSSNNFNENRSIIVSDHFPTEFIRLDLDQLINLSNYT